MKRAFTMLELMLAVMILSIMTIVSTLVFNNTVRNWTLATEMADNLQRVDYVVAQVTSALRSAYFRLDGKATDADGFSLVDGGDDPDESDVIGWTKLGPAIVGRNHKFAKSPHHVTLFVRKENDRDVDEYHPAGLVAKISGEESFRSDDYEEEEEEEEEYGKNEILLGHQVQGFNCRVLDKDEPFKGDHANWADKWDTSNCIPRRVQLTFWMKPVDEDKEPYPITRVVEIPLWDVSQNPVTATSDEDSNAKKNSGKSKTSGGNTTGTGGKSGGGQQGGRGGAGGGMGGGRGGGMTGGGGGMSGGGMTGGGGGMSGGGMGGGGAPGGGGMGR